MNNRLGPLLIDSLDKPNAVERTEYKQEKDYTPLIITAFGTAAFIFLLLFVFCLYRLHIESEKGTVIALYLLWIIYITPVVVVVSIAIGGVYSIIRWLHGWANKNNIISLRDGPHINTGDIRHLPYDQLFAMFANRMYDVAIKAAENSSYRGVQTLTLDQSSATTTTPQAQTADKANNAQQSTEGLYFDISILDRIN